MSPIRWRFTVAQKITAGLAVIIVIGMLSMLLIYRGLNIVENDVQKLAGVEAPLNAAAYEMEVNVNGIGLAVLKYLATGNPRYRALVEEDEVDFINYHATYLRLIKTERERSLGEEVGTLFQRFRILAHSLMTKRDEQERSFVAVAGHRPRDAVPGTRARPARDDASRRSLPAGAGQVAFRDRRHRPPQAGSALPGRVSRREWGGGGADAARQDAGARHRSWHL